MNRFKEGAERAAQGRTKELNPSKGGKKEDYKVGKRARKEIVHRKEAGRRG